MSKTASGDTLEPVYLHSVSPSRRLAIHACPGGLIVAEQISRRRGLVIVPQYVSVEVITSSEDS